MSANAFTVSALFDHPLKGGRARAFQEARVFERGLEHDRHWLAVDANNRFLTQRMHPALATIIVEPDEAGLRLSAEGFGDVYVARPSGAERAQVVIWRDEVDAALADAAAGDWLTRVLGEPARLVYMDADAKRSTNPDWGPSASVGFADGYPLLVTNSASLLALNDLIAARGGEPVPMARFRPNIVIDGADPWAEDNWSTMRIGDVEVELVKPCDRCTVTTRDQKTGADAGEEPLATLLRHRLSGDKRVKGALFGWNAKVLRPGDVSVGDAVDVTSERDAPWPIAPAVQS